MRSVAAIVLGVLSDLVSWIWLRFPQRGSLEAEVLCLRRQLALYVEGRVKPHRVDAATRASLMLLSRLFDWRSALVLVRPETLIRWRRMGWKLFWRLKSRPGRPPIPASIQALTRRMASENPLWGEERIANELLLKLGIRVSRPNSEGIPAAPTTRSGIDPVGWRKALRRINAEPHGSRSPFGPSDRHQVSRKSLKRWGTPPGSKGFALGRGR